MRERTVSAKKILQVAAIHKVTRGGLQASVTVAEHSEEIDREEALAAMRALLAILKDAEQA